MFKKSRFWQFFFVYFLNLKKKSSLIYLNPGKFNTTQIYLFYFPWANNCRQSHDIIVEWRCQYGGVFIISFSIFPIYKHNAHAVEIRKALAFSALLCIHTRMNGWKTYCGNCAMCLLCTIVIFHLIRVHASLSQTWAFILSREIKWTCS